MSTARASAAALAVVACLAAGIPWGHTADSDASTREDPGSGAEVLERARERLEAGDAETALAIFGGRVREDPTDADARAGRVRALLMLDRWEEALEQAREDRETLPGSEHVAAALGEASFRAGLLRVADTLLTTVADSPTAAPRTLVVLGRLRAAQGRDGEARVLLDRAYAAEPSDPEVVYWAAGAAPTRTEIVRRLERFIELGGGANADRLEAARGKIGLYQALGERETWIPGERPEQAAVTLDPVPDGAGGVRGYVLEATFDQGKPVRVMLDTGSGGLFMVHRIARKRGFEELAQETAFGGAGNKRHRSASGLLGDVSIAGVSYSDALITTTPQDLERTGRFHGLIGLSFWEGYLARLDLDGGRLELDRSQFPREDGQSYWNVSGQMLVEVETTTERTALFLLDTGATRTTLSLDFARSIPEARIGEPVEVWGYGGSFRETRSVSGVGVVFQDRETPAGLNAVDLSIQSSISGVEVSGLLGLDVLAGHVLVVDTRTQRVSLIESPSRKIRSKRKN